MTSITDSGYHLCMKPDAALDLQIRRYREMTGEQRMALALELHELACEVARAGIKAQHPTTDTAKIERLLNQRLSLASGLLRLIKP
ncbi:MAG: hypothetical protein Q7J98_00875 [Kiritimatiellia bacterium]|nr:hypothetical protein [Kiritimatiellia bacterium]